MFMLLKSFKASRLCTLDAHIFLLLSLDIILPTGDPVESL